MLMTADLFYGGIRAASITRLVCSAQARIYMTMPRFVSLLLSECREDKSGASSVALHIDRSAIAVNVG